ncbi:MAG: hypothetical protein ABIH83_00490 [Candidatus Micrarchaeota archaeon]
MRKTYFAAVFLLTFISIIYAQGFDDINIQLCPAYQKVHDNCMSKCYDEGLDAAQPCWDAGNSDCGDVFDAAFSICWEDCLYIPDECRPDIPPINSCSNVCGAGEKQKPYPDCSCEKTSCTNTCADDEIQNDFPDCSCRKGSCDELFNKCGKGCKKEKLDCEVGCILRYAGRDEKELEDCKKNCPTNQPCLDGCGVAKEDCLSRMGPDPCANVQCFDICNQTVYTFFYDGVCEPQPFDPSKYLCIYKDLPCQFCSNDSRYCLEICDNGLDDDNNLDVDCADEQCLNSSACICKHFVFQRANNPLNIVFVGKNYDSYPEKEREGEFQEDLKEAYKGFFRYEPFTNPGGAGLDKRIDMYSTRIKSGENKAHAMARCKTNNNDQYIFLEATTDVEDSYADICGGNAYVYIRGAGRVVDKIVLHEFGHSFGCLWDEYIYDEFPRKWYETIWKSAAYELAYEGHAIRYTDTNCAITPYKVRCQEYFSEISSNYQCIEGCTAPEGWWRSSNESIMKYPWERGVEYNDMSKEFIKRRMSAYG